jgi:hypothetical protein
MGQKATSARRCAMSVLPLGADMLVTGRFAPKAVIENNAIVRCLLSNGSNLARHGR